MINFIQINDTTHIGIQGISSITVAKNVLHNESGAPAAGSRPNIVLYETYGGEHVIPDDGAEGYYQVVLNFVRQAYTWGRYTKDQLMLQTGGAYGPGTNF